MTGLLLYDQARRAVEAARTFDEVRELEDKAAAIREYARRAKNRDMEIDAAEIRVRAQRRRGELIAELKAEGRLVDGRKKTVIDEGPFSRVTLTDLDTSKNESSEAQKLAAIAPDAFERLAARCRARMLDDAKAHAFDVLRERDGPVNGARAVMGGRVEPDDSLDYFPTPPWATRALVEYVLPHIGIRDLGQAWEPACGEGHIAGVLEEYASVVASDIHDYSDQERMPPSWWRVLDFLDPRETTPVADWIITNPPFGKRTEAFAMRALDLACTGVAMFVRLQWLETIGRYERLFRDRPPTLISFFCKRVNLCKGHWDPDGSTATAYIWCVWLKGEAARAPYWIPPGCRDGLSREGDRERFTAHPVAEGAGRLTHILPTHDPETGEIIESGAATSTAGIGSLHRPATENALAEEPSNPDGSGEAQDRGVSASPPHCRSAEADHGLTSGEKPPADGAAPEPTPVPAGAAPHSNVIAKPSEIPAFADDAPGGPAKDDDDGLDIPDFLKRKEGAAPAYGGPGL